MKQQKKKCERCGRVTRFNSPLCYFHDFEDDIEKGHITIPLKRYKEKQTLPFGGLNYTKYGREK